MSNPNPKNQMKKGETLNPNGRPKKGTSITEIAKKFLDEIPVGQEKTYKQIFFETVFKLAVVDKDITALKLVWNYVDGMPTQALEHTGKEGGPIQIAPIFKDLHVHSNDSDNQDSFLDEAN